jgi:PEP-CTERM motif
MVRLSTKCYLFGVMALLASFIWLAPTQAAPNYNPAGGMGSASDNTGPNNIWTSTLNPNPAIPFSYCPWITAGLNAQGFNTNNGWTINTYLTNPTLYSLSGSLSMTQYFAWVTTQPTYTINGGTFGGKGPFIDYGGADALLTYTPMGTDPTGANVRWIQGVLTNDPKSGLGTNGVNVGGGFTEYLDNGSYYGTNPYYGNLGGIGMGAITSTQLFDAPARSCVVNGPTVQWEAQTFISTWNPGAKTINIYGQGIEWGFNLSAVPEPGPFALLMLGLVGLVLRRHKPKAA